MQECLCWPQVVGGGADFFGRMAPPWVVLECDDGMIGAKSGRPAGAFLQRLWELGYAVFHGEQELAPGALGNHSCGTTATIHLRRRGPAAS